MAVKSRQRPTHHIAANVQWTAAHTDIIIRDITVVVLDHLRPPPAPPRLQILHLMPVRARIPAAGLVPVTRVRAAGDAIPVDAVGPGAHAAGETREVLAQAARGVAVEFRVEVVEDEGVVAQPDEAGLVHDPGLRRRHRAVVVASEGIERVVAHDRQFAHAIVAGVHGAGEGQKERAGNHRGPCCGRCWETSRKQVDRNWKRYLSLTSYSIPTPSSARLSFTQRVACEDDPVHIPSSAMNVGVFSAVLDGVTVYMFLVVGGTIARRNCLSFAEPQNQIPAWQTP